MQFLAHQQINILSGAVLFLFGIYATSVLDKKTTINKIYLASLFLNLFLINLVIILNLLVAYKIEVFWARVISCLLYILSPMLSYLFLKFICYYFSSHYKIREPVRSIFYVLIITNIFTAVFSSINRTFDTKVLSDYIVSFIISLVFLVYSVYVIKSSKKTLLKFEYAYILAISIITNILVFIQLLINETRFVWCSTTFTIIMMFIVIQQRELYRDSLTGARNRLVLKRCMDAYVRRPSGSLSVIMIDLDYFKNINDLYGHSEGDSALKIFVRLLQKVFSDNGIVIRMGGDEFLILIYNLSAAKVNELIYKMDKLVEKYNTKGGKPYSIKYSCASGVYKNDMSIEQFIHEIDLKMYDHKNNHRRKTWSIENEF
jgi:diguanylate cyclase (GGDEF)-like protein